MQWELFCRVIDNHGDLGVCWRLAVTLAERGQRVRLWVDDASALTWMAPQGCAGVQVLAWPQRPHDVGAADVVIEAFGCELPDWVAPQLARQARPAVWINLEYLSAESYVERAHRLPSPLPGLPGLRKWFFYPGYTPRTGGLIREPGLGARQRAFDPLAWLASVGVQRAQAERVVSLFCYEQPALDGLLDVLSEQPTVLLGCIGPAQRQLRALCPSLQRGALRIELLPALTQQDYDHLLWASELNFVRGEDSLVRAQWAGRPFVWQAYPQTDAVHRLKVQALADRYLASAVPALAVPIARLWQAWNTPGAAVDRLAPLAAWRVLATAWRDALWSQPDLTTQLLRFVAETR